MLKMCCAYGAYVSTVYECVCACAYDSSDSLVVVVALLAVLVELLWKSIRLLSNETFACCFKLFLKYFELCICLGVLVAIIAEFYLSMLSFFYRC